MTIRLAVVGAGLIAQTVHLPNMAALPALFDVVRICDLSPGLAQAVAASVGPAVSHGSDPADVLDDPGVDAVLICTPGAHSRLARAALERGKHVLAEKPYAYDPVVALSDAAFAESAGLVLQVGYMKMYEPALAAARIALEGIGPVHVVRMSVLHPSDENQTRGLDVLRGSGDVDPRALLEASAALAAEVDAALAGIPGADAKLFRNVLNGSVCHQASVLRALFPGDAVTAGFAQRDEPAGDEPPKLIVGGRLASGPQWALSWNWLTDYPAYEERVQVLGSKGSLTIDFPGPYAGAAAATLTVVDDEGARLVELGPAQSAFSRELVAFSESVTSGTPVLSTAADAAQDAALLRELAALLRP